ncbi:hypothetical protein CBR_g19797 [Chara braunii]|uniref:Protein kinase domain-containing protein n=1 Tax=Chara braunii TaxID=69332 RepID=A0A388JTZ6_CHABU|nr:hypothetical protein CBR_g19797 [Chara braunii]|eukprot:GBG61265.1 hypothetical protein CBR_g19797 [Chara braunii]
MRLGPSKGGSMKYPMKPPDSDQDISKPEIPEPTAGSVQVKKYSAEEIKRATNNFDASTRIGGGGFGTVYKATLRTSVNTQQTVAIKKLGVNSRQGINELVKEIEILPRLHHRHLVTLVGYCDDPGCLALVYEYVSNGTLNDHLYGSKATPSGLPWLTRISIALDVARALSYLHIHVTPGVIHRDIKPSNILIDQKMHAKLADFGLSKLLPDDEEYTHLTTNIKGTQGYLDPEYFQTRRLTERTDVYSFGVVVLELITGRKPLEIITGRRRFDLVKWARAEMKKGNIRSVLDHRIAEGAYSVDALWKLADCAMMCCEPHSLNRPNIGDVVRYIEETETLQREGSRSGSALRERIGSGAQYAGPSGRGAGGGGHANHMPHPGRVGVYPPSRPLYDQPPPQAGGAEVGYQYNLMHPGGGRPPYPASTSRYPNAAAVGTPVRSPSQAVAYPPYDTRPANPAGIPR